MANKPKIRIDVGKYFGSFVNALSTDKRLIQETSGDVVNLRGVVCGVEYALNEKKYYFSSHITGANDSF